MVGYSFQVKFVRILKIRIAEKSGILREEKY